MVTSLQVMCSFTRSLALRLKTSISKVGLKWAKWKSWSRKKLKDSKESAWTKDSLTFQNWLRMRRRRITLLLKLTFQLMIWRSKGAHRGRLLRFGRPKSVWLPSLNSRSSCKTSTRLSLFTLNACFMAWRTSIWWLFSKTSKTIDALIRFPWNAQMTSKVTSTRSISSLLSRRLRWNGKLFCLTLETILKDGWSRGPGNNLSTNRMMRRARQTQTIPLKKIQRAAMETKRKARVKAMITRKLIQMRRVRMWPRGMNSPKRDKIGTISRKKLWRKIASRIWGENRKLGEGREQLDQASADDESKKKKCEKSREKKIDTFLKRVDLKAFLSKKVKKPLSSPNSTNINEIVSVKTLELQSFICACKYNSL